MPQNLPVRLTAQGERHLRAKHPWIFSDSIESLKGEGKTGDLAVIFDRKKNKFIGVGLYDPDSPIRIKMLHSGGPARINAEFFQARIAEAHALRAPLLATDTNSYRLLNGENDGFPALIADVYAEVIVVKVYSMIWHTYFDDILAALLETTGCTTAVLRMSRNVQKHSDLPEGWTEGAVIHGELPNSTVLFQEHGITLSADVINGHKTGFFLDHRNNRKRVGELSEGKQVLDIFSYAGGFSVHALAGGAREVTSLDISAKALEVARANVALNFPDAPHKTIAGDAFEVMEKLARDGKTYGLLIVDPPSFAKKASEVEGALRAYQRLTKLSVPLVEKGGILLLASCSARVDAETFYELQKQALNYSGRSWKELERTAHDVDHPATFPEGKYLKSMYVLMG
ncbi:MAG: class I SAM-dependent rRNA methyltransferase [Saprospiraceae bacterium]